MEERPDSEPGERDGRRRLSPRSAIALAGIIAVAAGIGLVVSFGQRRPAPIIHAATTPLRPPDTTPTPLPQEPQAQGFSVADDLATHEVLLFGGVGDYGDTWLWNGSTWALAHPGLSPQGRYGASAAYDPQTRTVLLFGGRLEPGTPVQDTWAWNGAIWTELDTGAGGPQPGEGSDMAWDPGSGQMVLVTGSGVISNPAATWVWEGTHWRHLLDAELPAGAFYSPMSFDPVTRSLLAIGCCVGPPPSTGAANTTWRWNGATWTLLSTPVDAPVEGSTMALDPALGRLVLCTCASSVASEPALSVWDGAGWVAKVVAALPVQGGTAITDADRGDLLLLGSPVSATDAGGPRVQVWSLTGSSWDRLGASG